MHATRGVCRLGVALFWLVAAGCSSKEIRPGVTYAVSIITLGPDGQAAPQGPATRVESVVVGHVQEISHEGQTLSLTVRKTEYEKATFDVTFADQAMETVRIKAGQTTDVLPATQKVGVRIAVQQCR
jgi:hypothetical protein